MNVFAEPLPFQPKTLTIVLETQEDVDAMKAILHNWIDKAGEFNTSPNNQAAKKLLAYI